MSFKKSIDRDSLGAVVRRTLTETPEILTADTSGIAGDTILEPIPNFVETPGEEVLGRKGNSWIVLGRDRPGSRLSGYGGSGDTQASSIDMVVGRLGAEVKKVNDRGDQLWADTNFKKDAARIYISQKSDVDKNFGLVEGRVGNSVAKSTVALKADAVRIIAREGIKLVTRTDIKNSQGGKVRAVGGIDLIAGNNDAELQPIPKGMNLGEALDRIVHHMDKLNGIVDSFLMSQMEFNQALTHHFHYSPFFALPTTPAIDVVVPAGVKTAIDQLAKVKRSLVAHKANLAAFRITYLTPAGSKYINSRWNNVN